MEGRAAIQQKDMQMEELHKEVLLSAAELRKPVLDKKG